MSHSPSPYSLDPMMSPSLEGVDALVAIIIRVIIKLTSSL
jgi:hypothetical protein